MDFELRKLKSDDIFPMIGILSKVGFKDIQTILTPEKMKEMMKVFNRKEDEEVNMTTVLGMNIIFEVVSIIMRNLPSCKKEIYSFLSGLSGMKEEEIAELDIATFTEMIVSVIQKEEFKDFFKVVSRLFK